MKIDFLIAVAEKGGVENVVNEIALYLKTRNWSVRIVQLVWEGKEWANPDISFHPLLYGRKGHTLEGFVQVYYDFVKKKGNSDIVIATAWPYMSYVAKKVQILCGLDYIVLSWLHGPMSRYIACGFGGYEYLTVADAHLVMNKSMNDDISLHDKDAILIPVDNPVDFTRCRQEGLVLREEENKRKLVYVGRVSEEKRLDVMIAALKEVKDLWELHVIGNGDAKTEESMRVIAKNNRVEDSVKWMGWMENPWEYAFDADALVLASEYESFSLVAVEAAVNGIPVISTPVDGVVDRIKPGVNGFLFPFGDVKALGSILFNMVENITPISQEACKESVKHLEASKVLHDYERKLYEVRGHRDLFSLVKEGFGRLNVSSGISFVSVLDIVSTDEFVVRFVENLLEQVMGVSFGIELIFVLSSSNKAIYKIMEEYEKDYSENILLIQCEDCMDEGETKNIGLDYANGELVMFVDANVCFDQNSIVDLYERAVIYGCDVAECLCGSLYFRLYRGDFLRDNSLYFQSNENSEEFHDLCVRLTKRLVLRM